jgi:hypothetical protein
LTNIQKVNYFRDDDESYLRESDDDGNDDASDRLSHSISSSSTPTSIHSSLYTHFSSLRLDHGAILFLLARCRMVYPMPHCHRRLAFRVNVSVNVNVSASDAVRSSHRRDGFAFFRLVSDTPHRCPYWIKYHILGGLAVDLNNSNHHLKRRGLVTPSFGQFYGVARFGLADKLLTQTIDRWGIDQATGG